MENKFDYEKKIIQYIKSKDKKETPIIGLYMRAKGMKPENQAQVDSIYKRNIKPAKELICYSTDKIIETMKYLIDNADYKWTLESVLKCIDEDLYKLCGIEPIIKLKDGEQVYSVERIKQLERDGKIYYDTKGWKEVL